MLCDSTITASQTQNILAGWNKNLDFFLIYLFIFACVCVYKNNVWCSMCIIALYIVIIIIIIII